MKYPADPAASALGASACAAAACAASLGGAHPVVCALLSGVAAALAASAGCSPERPVRASPSPPPLPKTESTGHLAAKQNSTGGQREMTEPSVPLSEIRRSPVDIPEAVRSQERPRTPKASEQGALALRQATLPADDMHGVLKAGEDVARSGDSSSPSSVLSSRSLRVQDPRAGAKQFTLSRLTTSAPIAQELAHQASSRGSPLPRPLHDGGCRHDAIAAARAAEALADRDTVTAAAAIDSITDIQLRAALADAYTRISTTRGSTGGRRGTRRSVQRGDEVIAEIARQMSEVQSVASDHQHSEPPSGQAALRDAIRNSRMHSYTGQGGRLPSGLQALPSLPSRNHPSRAGRPPNVDVGHLVAHADSSGSSDDQGYTRTRTKPHGSPSGHGGHRPLSPQKVDSMAQHSTMIQGGGGSFRRPGHRGMSKSTTPRGHASGMRRWGTFASSGPGEVRSDREEEKAKVMSGMGRACDSSHSSIVDDDEADTAEAVSRLQTGEDLVGGDLTTPAPDATVTTVATGWLPADDSFGIVAAEPEEPEEPEAQPRLDHGGTTCKARKLGMNRSPSTSSGEDESTLEKVRREKPARVDMYRLSLTQLPSWVVGELGATVKRLDLSDNQLTALPDDLTPLRVLELLNLSTNKLTSIPDSISQLPCLTHLIMKVNAITSLPQDLGEGQQLEEINLSWNKLESFPLQLFRAGTLRNVNLTENPAIIALPAQWDQAAGKDCVLRLDNDPGLKETAAKMKGSSLPSFDWTNVFPDLVRPGLYLGPLRSAQDRVYKRLRITHVVTVGKELDVVPPPDVEHLKVEVADVPDEELVSLLAGAHRMIDSARAAGGSCFVHCFKGQSRSSTVVITYLMMTEKRHFANALAVVRAARPCVRPNEGFVQQMVRFEEALELEAETTKKFETNLSMTRLHSHSQSRGSEEAQGCPRCPSTGAKANPLESPQPHKRGRRQTWATANKEGSHRRTPRNKDRHSLPAANLSQIKMMGSSHEHLDTLQPEASQSVGGSVDRPDVAQPLNTPPDE